MMKCEIHTTAKGWTLEHSRGFLSARQTAKALGCTRASQVLDLGIPYLRRGDRCIFRLQDVADYIDRNIKQAA
jgi:hypothetical protein